MYHYNSQLRFCFLFLAKTFALMGSFRSQKVTHKPSINVTNIKVMKFDTVYSIELDMKILKLLFLHVFSRMLCIKSIIRFQLLQLNHIKQSTKKANRIFLLEFVGNLRCYVGHIRFAIECTIIDHWLKILSLKMDSHLTTKLAIFTSIKRSLKMMKNVFYFLLKCLFLFLRYLDFCADFFGYVKSTLMRKSQIGMLTISIRLLWSDNHEVKAFRWWNFFC